MMAMRDILSIKAVPVDRPDAEGFWVLLPEPVAAGRLFDWHTTFAKHVPKGHVVVMTSSEPRGEFR